MHYAFWQTTFIVYCVLVHCRVGSLENVAKFSPQHTRVHCRVGSLEIGRRLKGETRCVHCRVGSLEIKH